MGFQIQEIIRNENYYRTLPTQEKQDEVVLVALYLLKSSTASRLYLHFKEKYPLTSIRRSLNTLLNQNKIKSIGKIKSVLYNSTETEFKPLEFTEGLF